MSRNKSQRPDEPEVLDLSQRQPAADAPEEAWTWEMVRFPEGHQGVQDALRHGYEPFAVSDGSIYLKRPS